MRQIGTLSNENLIIEMEPMEWLGVLCDTGLLYDLPTICKDYRARYRLSQAALARQAGISRNWMSCIEKGTANISLDLYRRLMTIALRDEEVLLEG